MLAPSPPCCTRCRPESLRRPPRAVGPLAAILRQLADLLRTITGEQYRAKHAAVAASSIGGHVRHCLDHVQALLAGVEFGAVDYDRRERGTDIETDRDAALAASEGLERRLLALDPYPESLPLRLSVTLAADAAPFEVDTTLGRELAFVLSHTIHHNALVAVIAWAIGAAVPVHFGYAPSTLAYLEKTPCVR